MTEADLDAIRAIDPRGARIRVVTTSVGRVLVKRQRPARGAWRATTLNALTRAAGLPMLQAAPAPGGSEGQHLEASRLRILHVAGLAVPELLHEENGFIAMQYLEGESLVRLIEGEATLDGGTQPRLVDAAISMGWWQRGLDALAEVHRADQYLSQAFARNMVVTAERLWMIDFEDDPLTVMSLDQAQARDWLTYLMSTAWVLPVAASDIAEVFEHALARERSGVKTILAEAASRLAPLRHLPRRRKPWGREVMSLQALGAVIAAGFRDSAGDDKRHTP